MAENINRDVINYLYDKIVAKVISVLRSQDNYNYPNALIALGAQIASGSSLYHDVYEDTVKNIIYNEIKDMPPAILRALWDGIILTDPYYEYDDNLEIDFGRVNLESNIAEEAFQRVCQKAELAFDDYECEDE